MSEKDNDKLSSTAITDIDITVSQDLHLSNDKFFTKFFLQIRLMKRF